MMEGKLQTITEALDRSTGGFRQKTTKARKLNLKGLPPEVLNRRVTATENRRRPGTCYLIFICPACGARNRRPLTDAEIKKGEEYSVSCRCNRCYRELEIAKPQEIPRIAIPTGATK
jgi:hypothetical protein